MARQRTEATLESRLETLHPRSFGWSLSCCGGDRDAAEEVLQIAYVRVLEGKARFEGRSSLETWFFGVVRLIALEQRRRRWFDLSVLTRWRIQPEPVPTPEAGTSDRQQADRLRRALGRLSARQREILHLVFYEDLTVEQAAGVVGIGVGSARTHYKRGKRRLEQLLSGQTELNHDQEVLERFTP